MPARRSSVLRAFVVATGVFAISVATMGAASPTVHVVRQEQRADEQNTTAAIPWTPAPGALTELLTGEGPTEPQTGESPTEREIATRSAEQPSRSLGVSARMARVRSWQPHGGLPLMRGDRDTQRADLVSRVQRRLGISADGDYGNDTARAVKRFQAVHDPRGHRVQPGAGLPTTGVVDGTTLHAIRSSLRRSGQWLSAQHIARAARATPGAVADTWPLVDQVL